MILYFVLICSPSLINMVFFSCSFGFVDFICGGVGFGGFGFGGSVILAFDVNGFLFVLGFFDRIRRFGR